MSEYITVDLSEEHVELIVQALESHRDGDNEKDLIIDDIIYALGEGHIVSHPLGE